MPIRAAEQDALRIQLEGRLECIEALTSRWRQAIDLLASDEWKQSHTRWSALITSSENEIEALERLRAHPDTGSTVMALEAQQRRAAELAHRRFREIGFAPSSRGATELITELRDHLPLMLDRRFPTPVFTLSAFLWSVVAVAGVTVFTIVALLGGLVLSSLAHGDGSVTYSGGGGRLTPVFCCAVPAAGLLLARSLNRVRIRVTRRSLKIGRRQLDFASIERFTIQSWPSKPPGSFNHTRLEVHLKGGTRDVFDIGGDATYLHALIRRSGVPCDFT